MSLTNGDKAWITEQLAAQLNGFVSQLSGFASKEQLERVETALLTAFHQWASPVEMRQRFHAAAI